MGKKWNNQIYDALDHFQSGLCTNSSFDLVGLEERGFEDTVKLSCTGSLEIADIEATPL